MSGIENLSGVMKDIENAVKRVINDYENTVYKTARANTPVLTGNARRNWKKSKDSTGFAVENRVPYIERLDRGYSKKKPKGMTGPTLDEIKRR